MPFVAYQEELPVLVRDTREELESITYMKFTSIEEVDNAELIQGTIYIGEENIRNKKNEVLVKKYTNLVQNKLDEFAQSRSYDNMASVCSYATSTNDKFKVEAEYCVKLRDDTWAMCYQILNDCTQGIREIPTEEELLQELPIGSAIWPNE